MLCVGFDWTRKRVDDLFRADVFGCLIKEINVARLAAINAEYGIRLA